MVVPDAAGQLTEEPEAALPAQAEGVGGVQQRLGTDSSDQDVAGQAREGAERAVRLVLGLVIHGHRLAVGVQHEAVVSLAVIVRSVVTPRQVLQPLLQEK